MAINDTIELAVIGVVSGQDHIHTLHFRDMAGAATPEQSIIDDWQANCRDAYRALFFTAIPAAVSYRARQVCGSTPLRAPVEEAEAPANSTGTRSASGEQLPPWLAKVVTERTALAGRSRRGRFYIGGLHEGDINGDAFVTTYNTAVQTYMTTLGRYLPGGASASVFTLVVHSRLLAAVPGTQCQDSSTPVTSLENRVRIATQKSRRAGSGR